MILDPRELLASFGVDVNILPLPYSSWHIATAEDLWLKTLSADKLEIGDLIIETPKNYRSRIYTSKIPSKHVNLTGPDFYYYIYSPAYYIGTVDSCIRNSFSLWELEGITGSLSFVFDSVGFDVTDNQVYTFELIINFSTSMIQCAYKIRNLLKPSLKLIEMDKVLTKWGKRIMVQNYKDESDPSLAHYAYVGDG